MCANTPVLTGSQKQPGPGLPVDPIPGSSEPTTRLFSVQSCSLPDMVSTTLFALALMQNGGPVRHFMLGQSKGLSPLCDSKPGPASC